jgi:hypothetical protein
VSTSPRTRIAAGIGAAATLATFAVPSIASASAPESSALRHTKTKVSLAIHADGVDLFGTLTTAKSTCGKDRTVTVWRQVGQRGGGNDRRFAMDTSEHDHGHVYRWDTGNTGVAGHFYATVRATSSCRAASSATIHAVRPEN